MPDNEYAKAWDRVGRAMQAAGEVADVIVRRNIEVWSLIAENLRTSKKYTTEDWARDTSRGVTAAMDNARDMWTAVRAMPSTVANVAPLPTACLFFEPNPEQKPDKCVPRTYVLTAQPEIPISARVRTDKPPVKVRVTGLDRKTVTRLEECLFPDYAEDQRLVIVPVGKPELTPGIYQGILSVDLNERPAPIALLWIIVEA